MSSIEIVLLVVSGVFMGIVGVTSGGGATVGVPLVLLFGMAANTSVVAVKFALVGSFVTGTLAYRKNKKPLIKLPTYLWPLSIVGSVIGANLVLSIEPRVLKFVVLTLLIIVLALSFFLKPSAATPGQNISTLKRTLGAITIFSLCVYSGFFGAGFGTFLIFALMYFYGYTFTESASVGTKFSLFIVGSSVITFVLKDGVDYNVALPLLVGCAIGGVVGARLAQVVGDGFIRFLFFFITIAVTVKLGVDVI